MDRKTLPGLTLHARTIAYVWHMYESALESAFQGVGWTSSGLCCRRCYLLLGAWCLMV